VASEYFRSGADKVSIGSDAVFAAEEYLSTGVCFLETYHFTSDMLRYNQYRAPYMVHIKFGEVNA
jgi:imidazole glycerol phosphate synthase subunit HisF